jgi:IS605 OrfB family transposase
MVSLHRRLEVTDWSFVNGAIGIDLNVGFISVMPVDRSGNPLKDLSIDIPVETCALSSERAKAVIGDAVKLIVDMAAAQRRPLVIESLEFLLKKAALRETAGPNLARRLSSFSYNLVKTMLHSRAARFGVLVVEVNPAYTSHMGRAKYVTSLGISVHRAAAAMIARRGMGLSEGLFASAELPLGDGRHVALPRPVRIGRKHVWASWGKHFGRYKAARNALVKADRKVRSSGARNTAKAVNPAPVRCGNALHQVGEIRLVAPNAARGTAPVVTIDGGAMRRGKAPGSAVFRFEQVL